MPDLIQKIKQHGKFIASTEDDREHYNEQAEKIPKGWKEILDLGDCIVNRSGNHFCICDCGISDLYVVSDDNIHLIEEEINKLS